MLSQWLKLSRPYINIYGRYEKVILDKLREIIKQQNIMKTALDVGANIGNHTVFFSEFFEKVIALEPNPRAYFVLKMNTENLGNVSCMRIGASSKKTTLDFYVDDLNMGGSRIIQDHNNSSIKIDVSPLDEIESIREQSVGFVKGHLEKYSFRKFGT